MSLWTYLFGCGAVDEPTVEVPSAPAVNPATGLPMLGDCLGGIDVGGNPWGLDLHDASCGGRSDAFDCFPDEF